MSERIGKMLTCDRCGSFVFLNYTAKQEVDGGFTSLKNVDFEDPPKGWGRGNAPLGDKLSACDARLCPDCYKEYCYMIRKFYNKNTVAESVRERSTVHEP